MKGEAAAYGLLQLLPEKMWTVEQLSYLYSGTYLPLFQRFSDRQKRIWSNLKVLLPSWKSKGIVTHLYEQYFHLQVPNTFLHLSHKDGKLIWNNLTQYSDRTAIYEQLLTGVIPHVSATKEIATHDVNTKFKDMHREFSFQIPTYIQSSQTKKLDTNYTPKEEFFITKKDLLEAAGSLDELEREIFGEAKHRFRERIEPLVFHECIQSHSRTDVLYLAGTQHWAGTLSSGKSTMMDVLAFYLHTQNKVTTLVVGDVATVLTKVDYFQSLGIKAVPIISYRQRKQHIHDYMQAIDESFTSLQNFQKHAMRYLCDICMIQEMQEHDVDGPPPCFHLKQNNRSVICPYFFECPYHYAYHDLSDATIFVATIQGLVYSEFPPALSGIRMRMLEYVYRRSHLILVDEADRVQSQLDQIFAPEEEVAGSPTSWLERLHRKMNEELYKSKLALKNPQIDKWNRTLQNAMSAVYLAYSQLQQERGIYTFVGKQYFTAYKLLLQFTLSLLNIKNDDEQHQVSTAFQKLWGELNDFLRFYQDDEESGKLSKSTSLRLLKSITNQLIQDDEESSALIKEWLELTSKRFNLTLQNRKYLLEKKLRFALTILLLEKCLFYLVRRFDVISAEFEHIDIEQMASVFQGPPKDYEGLMPISPTGIGMGFRYESEEQAYAKGGILKFTRIIGVGRYILTHLDRFFEPLDGKKGAAVILLSGTSRAPLSAKYEIQLPVHYFMEKEGEEPPKVEVVFAPLYNQNNEPISVSGKEGDKRNQALQEAVAALKRTGIVDQELESASDGRKRLLMVVGSYEEAELVGQEMRNMFERKDIYYLTKKYGASLDEGAWPRQKVASFVKSNGSVLVVPLLALERGHNILCAVDSKKVAAFHTAMFLVRPYPRPFDMSRIVSRLNAYTIEQILHLGEKHDTIREAILHQRKTAYAIQKSMLLNERGFRYLDMTERRHLTMDLFVPVWQLTGRLIRGNVPAKIVLCDASFAPETVIANRDTCATSLILTWKDEVEGFACQDDSFILQKLYEPIIQGLKNVKGVLVDENAKETAQLH